MLARSKMVGAWETGEGEQVPPPREPPPPMAISPRSTAWGDPGEEPDTVFRRLHPRYGFPPAPPRIRLSPGSTPDTAASLISPRTDPAPTGGGGGAPKARVGRGCRQKCVGSLPAKARVGWGPPAEAHGYPSEKCRQREARWLERERQGRGNKFPRPASRHPQWRYPHGPAHGEILEKSRARLSRRLHPGYGCSPDIASTAPAPGRGGGGAPKARVGRGCRQKCMGSCRRRCGRGGGCRQRA